MPQSAVHDSGVQSDSSCSSSGQVLQLHPVKHEGEPGGSAGVPGAAVPGGQRAAAAAAHLQAAGHARRRHLGGRLQAARLARVPQLAQAGAHLPTPVPFRSGLPLRPVQEEVHGLPCMAVQGHAADTGCMGLLPEQDLARHFPTLCADGVDLMERMFAYNPAERITVCAQPSQPALTDVAPQQIYAARCKRNAEYLEPACGMITRPSWLGDDLAWQLSESCGPAHMPGA